MRRSDSKRGSVLCAAALAAASAAAADDWYAYPPTYGRWQARRPLLFAALHNSVPTDRLPDRMQRFKAAGLNTLIWWKPGGRICRL